MSLVQTFAHALLETALNQALRLDPAHEKKLQTMVGQHFAIKLAEWPAQLSLLFTAQGVEILADQTHADCVIQTSIWQLQQLQDTSQITAMIRSGQLQLDGKLEVAQSVAQFFTGLNWRWQDKLAPFIGDANTWRLEQGVKTLFNTLKTQGQIGSKQLQELLQDELLVSPAPQQVQAFITGVDELRDRTELLAQKLQQLTFLRVK